jgi:hypothetical protein
MTDDNSNIPEKYDLDLDELSDDKPIVAGTRKLALGNRVDFTKTSEQNKGRYISIGQIEELMKMAATERQRIIDSSLTKQQVADIEGHQKMLAEFGKKISENTRSLFTSGSLANIKLPNIDLPDISRYVQRPDPIAYVPRIEPSPTAKEQYRQTSLMQELVDTIKAQSGADNSKLPSLLEPRYDKRKHVLIFANTPIKLTPDSDADLICGRLFRSGKPVKHPFEKGDLIDLLAIREPTSTKRMKVLYNKVASVNRLVEKETGAEKLFDFIDKKLWFNTIYVKLPL